ncbi:hypothetical protein halTADL_0435 [Halohasta litchfieldiae]|jgi:hypothetical protein|uniref:Uncharacterized protein n=1 Tax=Halohasta litchfieldiae TaxID=1073996 RepID=A0A1H6VVA6_9EURY|nr:hypothetical protein [Halohasta litchfieldiae]ATW87248.1 hypothetical protein halTADL_0435 [Halohasta litchfieldiae]SEJ08618.1 hypothetical protein SAMN05444271_12028 [Halohasta litchfieldiae]
MDHARRRYLRYFGGTGAVLLGGLAGCTGRSPDGLPPSETNGSDNSAGGTRPEGTGGPGVTLVSTDEDPDIPVQPSVEIVRDTATEDHPPRLRTTLENTSDEPLRVGEGRAVHFEHVTADSGLLTLLPGDGEYPAEADCWRLTELIATTDEYQTFEIDAGDSSSRLVDLYATPDADGCLPVGEHRFESTISIVSDNAEPQSSAEWGFSVILE